MWLRRTPCSPHLWSKSTIANAQGGPTGWCNCTPSEPCGLESGEAAPQEKLALIPRWRPPPPPWLLSFSGQMSPDSPQPEQADWPMNIPLESLTGFCLHGVHAGDYLTFSSDRWSVHCELPVPGLLPWCPWPGHPYDHGPAHTPRSAWLWGSALSEFNTLYLIQELTISAPRLLGPRKWPGMCCTFVHANSMINTSKHDRGFSDYWMIWCYLTHTHTCMFIFSLIQVHSVFIHHVLVNFSLVDQTEASIW